MPTRNARRGPPGEQAAALNDPYDLDRFVRAQRDVYEDALGEIRAGRKRTHWMWFIFPQFAGLGFSPTSEFYAIRSEAEATVYVEHETLGPRLIECCTAALAVSTNSARDVFGSPDDMKLRSSATLFASVSPGGSVFEKVLDKYFGGEPDGTTLQLILQRKTGR